MRASRQGARLAKEEEWHVVSRDERIQVPIRLLSCLCLSLASLAPLREALLSLSLSLLVTPARRHPHNTVMSSAGLARLLFSIKAVHNAAESVFQ